MPTEMGYSFPLQCAVYPCGCEWNRYARQATDFGPERPANWTRCDAHKSPCKGRPQLGVRQKAGVVPVRRATKQIVQPAGTAQARNTTYDKHLPVGGLHGLPTAERRAR